jgi:hypothetical protein
VRKRACLWPRFRFESSEGSFPGIHTAGRRIYRVHQLRIKTAEACVRARMLEYGEGLILAFWPQLRGKTVRLEELVSMELTVDKPDPDDFL